MHELNSCSGGCVSRAVACLLANAFGAVAGAKANRARSRWMDDLHLYLSYGNEFKIDSEAPHARPFDHVATYETSAYNPLLLAMTISILGVAALGACLFPARRASLINPIDALRIE
jgi:ABC-type lipoprotein release transport system permease subunit